MDVKVKRQREARMRIGDLARATGVSPRLLRCYEEQGLLRPARRANGYREYTASDVAEVSRIRALLAAGLRTDVIAQVRDCVNDDGERLVSSGCSGIVDHLQREGARIADAIERLPRSQQALDTLLTVEPSRGAELTADGSEQQSGQRQRARCSRGRRPFSIRMPSARRRALCSCARCGAQVPSARSTRCQGRSCPSSARIRPTRRAERSPVRSAISP